MGKFSKQHLINFMKTSAGLEILQTSEGAGILREANGIVSQNMISAAQYYMGVPDGKYFEAGKFDESVVKAKKAYVTLNTLMGGETAEQDRFNEGKKQVPEMLTLEGVKKMIHLFTYLYCLASGSDESVYLKTVRACRQSEVSDEESVVGALASTTKLSVDEIMKLGYGNKNGLAICFYKFHEGAVVLDMEKLGENYLKPEEREVLLLMGNRLVPHFQGYDSRYLGKDGKPALICEFDVYPPEFKDTAESTDELERVVYDENVIKEVKEFYTALNEAADFPEVPKCYPRWKDYFQKIVFQEIKKLS